MNLTIYQVDAFTDQLFGVVTRQRVCPADKWLPTKLMQNWPMKTIYQKLLFVRGEHYNIRWFYTD